MSPPVPIGTASGRVLFVGTAGGYHITLSDSATHHAGYTLLSSQARDLGSALIEAANAIEGRVQPVTQRLSE